MAAFKGDGSSPGLLYWRSFLQWLGGIGIIVMALFLLPFMKVAGMQLFRTESSDNSDKILSNPMELIRWIASLYLALTLSCALIYGLLGMSAFDAINHAMTTISTGGFSTHTSSFAFFESPLLHWAAIIFMMLGALPFVLYIRALNFQRINIVSDAQVGAFLIFLAVSCLIMALWLFKEQHIGFGEALTLTSFNIVSVVTTTGFASADYSLWGPPAVGAFFLLTFIGGCSGSTSGGIKIYRFQILFQLIHAHLQTLVSPSRVTPISYNGRTITTELTLSILSFLIIFLTTVALVSIALAAMGLDFMTALTAAATAVANVGPGLGSTIGPAGNFAPLPDAAKLTLTLAMIAGRLEFFTLMVIFTKGFWVR